MTSSGLACFDFDWSLIEIDSDRFVMEQLSPEYLAQLMNPTMQWTDLQNHLMAKFFASGGQSSQIISALQKIPLHPDMIATCKLLKSKGWTLAILSDANMVYVETILEHYKIRDLFSFIVTNPASWTEQGQLVIERHIKADATPHGCPLGLCSLNICKGQEMDKLLETKKFKKLMYVGDGRNDYCPGLRLRDLSDLYFVRRGKSLEKLLEKDEGKRAKEIEGQIYYWESPTDILEIAELYV